MKCKQCGAEVSEGARFCENCGARVEAEVSETPVVNEAVAAEEVKETVKEEVAEEASFAQKSEEFSPIPKEPAKKKKVPVLVPILIALVVIAGALTALVCFSKVAGNTFRKWFLSPEKYLAYVLNDNFGKGIDDGLTAYDEFIKNYGDVDNINSKVSFDITLGDEFSKYIGDYAGALTSDAEWVTWVKKASFEYGLNSYKGDKEFSLSIGANDVKLISATANMFTDGDIYISVPELCGKALHLKLTEDEMEEIKKLTDMTSVIYKELPTKPELQSISKKYLKAVYDNIDGVKRTNDSITVEDITAKATKLSMDLDDVILTKMEIAILEQFLEDTEFKKIWNRVYDAYEEVMSASGAYLPAEADSYDEIKKNAKEALKTAKKNLEAYEDGSLDSEVRANITFYVDNKGVISGCSVSNEDFEISFIEPTKSGSFGVEAVMETFDSTSDTSKITIVGTGKESDSVITGELSAYADDKRMFDIIINEVTKNINATGEGSFDIALTNVNFDEASQSDLEIFNEILGDTNVGFYYKGKISKGKTEVELAIGTDNKTLFSVGAATEVKEGSKQTVEGKESALELDLQDEEALIEIIKALDEKEFAQNLRKAGAYELLVTTIEDAFASLKDLLAYY